MVAPSNSGGFHCGSFLCRRHLLIMETDKGNTLRVVSGLWDRFKHARRGQAKFWSFNARCFSCLFTENKKTPVRMPAVWFLPNSTKEQYLTVEEEILGETIPHLKKK